MKIKLLVALATALTSGSAAATIVEAEFSNTSANTWTANYTLTNDSLGSAIEQFAIFFDLGLYENLSVVSAPDGWDPLVLQPDSLIPDDGLFDALALGPALLPGETIGGFTVSFDFLGADAPGSQFFEILDPFTFSVIDFGQTVVSFESVDVASPTTLGLVLIGLVGLFAQRRKTAKT